MMVDEKPFSRAWFATKLMGKPLASVESEGQKIGLLEGLPILGLDGLSSAAYGPEAAMIILLPLGAAGLDMITPIMAAIVGLLFIVYLSYLQTIAAYPNGGGSYTVARENLGETAGLWAATALLLDYILTVAVGISAGVNALVSAVPSLFPYTLPLCLGILALVTLINLRGVRDTGLFMGAPTYLFVIALGTTVIAGLYALVMHTGHAPVAALDAPPAIPKAVEHSAGLWLLLRAFASGCTAMTGIETVNNAVGAFREPAVTNAKRTLTAITVILGCLVMGIAYLAHAYHIGAMDQTQQGYQTVVSQLIAATMGRGAFYYVSMGVILVVLALSANTSFTGFPRMARMLAEDHYFPHMFSLRGRRLVYTIGILFLAFVAGLLLIAFRGVTESLIPLYAVGAFLAFTLSQAGMVMHWRRHRRSKGAHLAMALNGLGAFATGSALIILLIAKFTEGAWIIVLLVPMTLWGLKAIHQHYKNVAQKIDRATDIDLLNIQAPIAVVPIEKWNLLSENGLRFALRIAPEVHAVHVVKDEEKLNHLRQAWREAVTEPLSETAVNKPDLIVLPSPYRLFLKPFMDYVLKLECQNPDRTIAVVVPELVHTKWYQSLLHNHRAKELKEALLREGDRRIVVIDVPWYLNEKTVRPTK